MNGAMGRLKKYKFGFDIWGLLLFFAIMIPNVIWFALPAPDDILRADSVTGTLDAVASVCQVLMVAALCICKNIECRKLRLTPLILAVIFCCVLYFASWIAYYAGVVHVSVILGLTLPPCLAFLLFSADRKNGIAAVPGVVFAVCHLIYGAVNFLV